MDELYGQIIVASGARATYSESSLQHTGKRAALLCRARIAILIEDQNTSTDIGIGIRIQKGISPLASFHHSHTVRSHRLSKFETCAVLDYAIRTRVGELTSSACLARAVTVRLFLIVIDVNYVGG